MKTGFYKVTLSDKWIYEEKGFFKAKNHKEAIFKIDPNVKRIFNERFREIETTGRFYIVEEINAQTHIYE